MKRSSDLRRLKQLRRHKQMRERNPARVAKRRKKYQAFMASAQWRQQKARVHERDGWQCTWEEEGQRCGFTRADGILEAHHLKYRHRIEETPDHEITTRCKPHHALDELAKWWKRKPRRVA